MFCTKCGAQNPDTSAFCEKCGSPLTAQSAPAQPSADVQASPMQQAQPMQQPGQFPQQSFGQPMGQPAYAAPVYADPGTKKSKTVPIIIGACAAVVVAFVVILFTVIIPGSGVKGKLRHKWTLTNDGVSITYDFKENTISALGMLTLPIEWDVKGDDRLTITMSMSLFGETQTETEEFLFSLSSNGKQLTLKDPANPSDSMTLNRTD